MLLRAIPPNLRKPQYKPDPIRPTQATTDRRGTLLIWGYLLIAAIVCSAVLFGVVMDARAATGTLETSNTTTDNTNGTNNYVYIGTTDRTTLYDFYGDTLSTITIKLYNGTGNPCNDITAYAYVNAAETASDQTLFSLASGASAEVEINFTTNPDIVLSDIQYIRFAIGSCWSGLTYHYNSTDVWGSDAGTYYDTAPKDPWIKIYGLPAFTWTIDSPVDDGYYSSNFPIALTARSNTKAYGPAYDNFYLEASYELDDGGWSEEATGSWTWTGALWECGAYDCYKIDVVPPLPLPAGDWRVRVRSVRAGVADAWSDYNYFNVAENAGSAYGGGGSWSAPEPYGANEPPTCSVFGTFYSLFGWWGDESAGDGWPCLGEWISYWLLPTSASGEAIRHVFLVAANTPPISYWTSPAVQLAEGIEDGQVSCVMPDLNINSAIGVVEYSPCDELDDFATTYMAGTQTQNALKAVAAIGFLLVIGAILAAIFIG